MQCHGVTELLILYVREFKSIMAMTVSHNCISDHILKTADSSNKIDCELDGVLLSDHLHSNGT